MKSIILDYHWKHADVCNVALLQIAEVYKLEHTSIGEGGARHIVVKKTPKTKSELKLEQHPVAEVISDVPDAQTTECK